MTLNISKLIKNILEKQMKIQHFDAYVKVFLTSEIPEDVSNKILDQFGEEYLNDAKYVIFYRGHIDKKKLKKMFNLTDKALGEDANRLTEGDFKQLKMSDDDELIQANDQDDDLEDSSSDDTQQQDDAELEKIVNNGKTDDNSSDSKEIEDSEKYLPPDMKSVDESNDEDSTTDDNDTEDDDVEDTEKEDSSDEVSDEIDGILNSSDGISSNTENIPLRFFFLKITLNK